MISHRPSKPEKKTSRVMRPTLRERLETIDQWIKDGSLEEGDLIEHFSDEQSAYVWMPLPGGVIDIKVVGADGKKKTSFQKAVVKEIHVNRIVVEG